jgi:hypothetical protein
MFTTLFKQLKTQDFRFLYDKTITKIKRWQQICTAPKACRTWEKLAELITASYVGKTAQQQHNWQYRLHFPPFCSKSHEETMVSHWPIDSSSSALSSQHPQTLRFFPREVKNIKHDRYFPQGLERSSCHARRLAKQVSLVCGRLKANQNWEIFSSILL